MQAQEKAIIYYLLRFQECSIQRELPVKIRIREKLLECRYTVYGEEAEQQSVKRIMSSSLIL